MFYVGGRHQGISSLHQLAKGKFRISAARGADTSENDAVLERIRLLEVSAIEKSKGSVSLNNLPKILNTKNYENEKDNFGRLSKILSENDVSGRLEGHELIISDYVYGGIVAEQNKKLVHKLADKINKVPEKSVLLKKSPEDEKTRLYVDEVNENDDDVTGFEYDFDKKRRTRKRSENNDEVDECFEVLKPQPPNELFVRQRRKK